MSNTRGNQLPPVPSEEKKDAVILNETPTEASDDNATLFCRATSEEEAEGEAEAEAEGEAEGWFVLLRRAY